MSKRDNTVDKFLNSLSRVVSNHEKYDQIGLELGFAQYELDGRWTNAHGNVNMAASRVLTDWHNRTIAPTKFHDLAVAFKNVGLHEPYVEIAVKNKCLSYVPPSYRESKMPQPPSYESVLSEKDARMSVEESSPDKRTRSTASGSVQAENTQEMDVSEETTSVSESFAAMPEEGDNTEDESSWEPLSIPEESEKWNPPEHLPPKFDESFEITSLASGVSQIALPTPESPFFRLMVNSFYNLRHTYTAHAVIINNCCDEFKVQNQFGDKEPGRLEKSTDRHRDVLKTMGCKVDYGKDMKGHHIDEFLHNLAKANFSESNMFWLTVVAHGDEKGKLKDFNKQEVRDFSVDRIIEIACRNRTLIGKPKIFFFMACKGLDYDAGQQIALGGEGTVPRVLPTFADVLAAFPTWQGQVALFVPNNDNQGERMNAIEYLNDLLEPGKLPRPRRLATVLKLWKRYHADSVFRTKHGQNVKQTPWVQDSLRDDVYL